MNVFYGIGRYNLKVRKVVLVIGVFDGVHVGHQVLLKAAKKRAKEIKGKIVVMTFYPHPVHVLYPDVNLPLLVSLEHRLHLFKIYGVSAVLIVKFTKIFAGMGPAKFIKKYLKNIIKPCDVFVGNDFRFGQSRSGSSDMFKQEGVKYGFNVHAVKPLKGRNGKISSTQIRQFIAEGCLKGAKKFMGHDVAVMGKIVKGDQRGKKLGFPTANLEAFNGMIPPKGVYSTRVEINGKYYDSMTNIGKRPSFTPLDERTFIETHIFNFLKNIYGKIIILHFIKKIREERVFVSQDKLITQLHKDVLAAKRCFNESAMQCCG